MSTLNVNRVVDASGGVLAPISSVMRNRIINGAMVIDQRNAGASVTPAQFGAYSVDRWLASNNIGGKYSVQQNAGAVTPPVGFTDYLGATSTSAYSVGSTDQFALIQNIEGFNIADLGWGTANAKPVTLSFWVRSSLTGTFGGSLQNDAGNRSYPFSFTINSANTWEYETITIAGDTTGTWLTTNGRGIRVILSLGAGSSVKGTAGAWAASNFTSATGAVDIVGTNGATFYITGVQLEVGTQATSFEYRQYQQELALCQRYYYEFDVSDLAAIPCWAQGTNVTNCRMMVPVTMRTALTASYAGTIGDSTQDWSVYNNNAFRTINLITISGQTNQSFRMEMTVDTGIAAADASGLYATNTDSGAKLRASAEL